MNCCIFTPLSIPTRYGSQVVQKQDQSLQNCFLDSPKEQKSTSWPSGQCRVLAGLILRSVQGKFVVCFSGMFCSDYEHRLYKELFANYNKIIRPVENVSDPVMVWFEVSLSQLVKVVSNWRTFSFIYLKTLICLNILSIFFHFPPV